MMQVTGYQGQAEPDDVDEVRGVSIPAKNAHVSGWHALYLSRSVLVTFDDRDPETAARYLQRVADQALALIAEIGTAAAAAAEKAEAGE